MKVSHSFIKAVEEAEKRLSRVLNSRCRINVHNDLDEELMKTIQDIEKEKFSEDLRYMREDLILRKGKKGFICLTLEVEGKSIAFDMGYEDEEGIFFSDDTATLIEGKGIGRTLFALEILYSHELGYKQKVIY